jgi:hypothetical protein
MERSFDRAEAGPVRQTNRAHPQPPSWGYGGYFRPDGLVLSIGPQPIGKLSIIATGPNDLQQCQRMSLLSQEALAHECGVWTCLRGESDQTATCRREDREGAKKVEEAVEGRPRNAPK